jgi:hypothetical protein
VPQPSTETLEVFAAEFAHNVLWGSLGALVPPAFDPWSHCIYLVLDKGIPGLWYNIHIASLAVEVSGVVALVVSHLLVCLEGLVAAWYGAWHHSDWLEWDVHVGGGCAVSWKEVSVLELVLNGCCWDQRKGSWAGCDLLFAALVVV